jgi:hypothetical protein
MTAPLRKPKPSKAQQQAATQARLNRPDRNLLPGLIQERHKLYQQRLENTRKRELLATPTRITNASITDTYDGAELRPYEGRPGAMVAFGLPSRGMGG